MKNKNMNSRNIFLIGAGFSKYFFNLPLNNEIDILEKIKKSLDIDFSKHKKFLSIDFTKYNNNSSSGYLNEKNDIVISFSLFLLVIHFLENKIKLSEKLLESLKWILNDDKEIKNIDKMFDLNNNYTKIKNLLIKFYFYLDKTEIIFTPEENEIIDIISNILQNNKKDINKIIKHKISFSSIVSWIEFEIKELKNKKSVSSYYLINSKFDLFKYTIFFFLNALFKEKKELREKKKLNDMIDLLKGSLVINFNWDNELEYNIKNNKIPLVYSFLEYSQSEIEDSVLLCKIHNSIKEFNIIYPSIIKNTSNELFEIDKYISIYDDLTRTSYNNQKINIFIIGMSLRYYDEVFLYKLKSISAHLRLEFDFHLLDYKNNEKENIVSSENIFYKRFSYSDFSEVIEYILKIKKESAYD